MGLFDMFKKKDAAPSFPVVLAADAAGAFVKMEDIPDEVFAQGILGQCCGIDPSEGKVYAPCDGEITQAPDTLHAFGITTPGGVEVLIHIGIDTVNLQGKHFTALAGVDDLVEPGTPLVEIERQAILDLGYDLVTPVLVVNNGGLSEVLTTQPRDVEAGMELMKRC